MQSPQTLCVGKLTLMGGVMRNDIGKRIKDARVAYGWTQTKLADYPCVSRAAISLKETGENPFSVSECVKVSKRFGLDLVELITGMPAHVEGGDDYSDNEKLLVQLYRSCYSESRLEIFTSAAKMADWVGKEGGTEGTGTNTGKVAE